MRQRLIFFIPLALFLMLAGYFFVQLKFGRDPSLIPSVMVDRPAPAFAYDALDPIYSTGLSADALSAKRSDIKPVKVVNFFASWCVPCRAEHPFLLEIRQDNRFSLIGIAYKDKREAAIGFIQELGNPYQYIVQDANGDKALEWGLYGVPETYIIDHQGVIRYKYTGPLITDQAKQAFIMALDKIIKSLPPNP